MQMRQTQNDEVVDGVKEEDSRKVKSHEVYVINQKPKLKILACSVDGNDRKDVSQTTEASTE